MQLLHSHLFLIPFIVLFLSESVKLFFEGIKTGQWHQNVFQAGGMPSSHSAFVTSLAIIVWKKTGIESVEFAIAICFAGIVWYDAVVTRKVLGEQGKLLNRLQHWQHFAERLGHSLKEVLAGIAFGAAVTAVGIFLAS
ncbi:divergent PAP2 family protein [Candidatus Peregrinibacteria bacterium]|jgi:uncharacterized protein|nr:divergent PAP2 family protein [Candidatus Peregrinibacteria bacterium]MBT3598835.1 divergent PAP2 family protein [Candidatus Peregrinibacteria bacterium]MBT4366913.1 divergent PAP2 family protein [Candidatus Peregrinibacteria bacterium]MBT4585413.1 divergent PAP2 family protein [Candidatus Peregrinibacteria bacterium]MBT6731155.1 divergent PAP2 family protein [Candidatus Peregrinibacteria bacterium]